MKSIMTDFLLYHLSTGKITGLYRHAVKGLSADSFETVKVNTSESFPDDRRFALLKPERDFDVENPEWLHKENFLCAFSVPELMVKYRTSYSTQLDNPSNIVSADGAKLLTLHERSNDKQVLGPIDLATSEGRQFLADFFSELSGVPLTCVTAEQHQFGNTSSGWKQKKDTRTIHIVNESTVHALSSAIGTKLDPTRFRPNIVLRGDNLEPFSEWDWIGKSIQCGSTRLGVIAKTVRCAGVSVDPLDFPENVLDIPALMVKHFPEHGPYLGVYAVVEEGGEMSLGDDITLL